jgi:hypothetical protein
MNNLLEAMHEFVMTWFDPVGVVVGLIIAVPVLWTWYEVVLGASGVCGVGIRRCVDSRGSAR